MVRTCICGMRPATTPLPTAYTGYFVQHLMHTRNMQKHKEREEP